MVLILAVVDVLAVVIVAVGIGIGIGVVAVAVVRVKNTHDFSSLVNNKLSMKRQNTLNKPDFVQFCLAI
ncbi:hypothetical protein B4U84_28780 [Westiellopsis prolifica IICB1]|nr:hypothetical protein B4U84_28780 [Westiellopsis prolifica IICB1]